MPLPTRLQPAEREGAVDVVARGDHRDRRHGQRVHRDAGARARLSGDAGVVGPAAERHRAAGGRRLRDDERDRTGRRPHGGGSAAGGPPRGGRAGLARGRRHRGRAPARHQRRCQRADARRVAEGAGGPRQREGDVGPVLHAGPVRNRRGQARGPRIRGPRPRAQHPHRAGHVEGRRRLRRRRQRLRLRDLGRLHRPQRQLPAAQQRLPVRDGEAAISRRLRRLRRGVAQEPAPAGAGRPRAAVLRRPVAHRHARSSPCSAGWSPW